MDWDKGRDIIQARHYQAKPPTYEKKRTKKFSDSRRQDFISSSQLNLAFITAVEKKIIYLSKELSK